MIDDDGPVMFVLGECFACHRPFTFSATRVPSVVINGHREPICQHCVDRVNPRRIANGLDPIVPLPGAYDPDPGGSE
jgi:hypothetical protein